MNLTFVLPDGLTLGGITTWSIEMRRRLIKQGHAVTLLEHPNYYNATLNVNLPFATQQAAGSEQAHPNSPFLREHHIANYLPAYRAVLPGVIIPNWSYGAYAACAALAKANAQALRVVGFAHTDEPDYYEWLTYYEPLIHRFVAVSQEIAATLIERLPHRANDILVLPYAVEVPTSLSRTYTAPPFPLQLIYAGRLWERQKRISDLIHLAQALVNEGVNFHLRIIGNGPDEGVLVRKLRKLDRGSRSHITLENGIPPDQMFKVWHSADIFLLVSNYEGTSIAMLEAMAQGCVPVVTNVSGAAAIIRSNENGFLLPVGDIIEMVRVIKDLDLNRSKLAQIGNRAFCTMVERFSYDEYMSRFLQIIGELWAQPDRPWPVDRPVLPPELKK